MNNSIDQDYNPKFMLKAIELSEIAYKSGKGLPIGCVIVRDGEIIGEGHNEIFERVNPTSHGEMVAIERACKNINSLQLSECQMYTTLEPCPMCLGALLQARVGRLVYGCLDPKRFQESGNFSFPTLKDHLSLSGNNHTVTISGPVLEEDCSQILKKFFKERRKK